MAEQGSRMKLYLGGPMRGLPNYNFQAFEDATTFLRTEGHIVTSPHEIDIEQGLVDGMCTWHSPLVENLNDMAPDPWSYRRVFEKVETTEAFTLEGALKRDIAAISRCDAVAFLEGWEKSEGCRIEDQVRAWLKLPRYAVVDSHGDWVLQLDSVLDNPVNRPNEIPMKTIYPIDHDKYAEVDPHHTVEV